MYNTKFECRYDKNDVFLGSGVVNENEKNYIRDILYKEDLLIIFSIDFENDFEELTNCFNELYEKIKNFAPLKKCMKHFAASIMSEDEQSGLLIMYSYHYMNNIHKCISEYLDTGTLTEKNMQLLIKLQNNIIL